MVTCVSAVSLGGAGEWTEWVARGVEEANAEPEPAGVGLGGPKGECTDG